MTITEIAQFAGEKIGKTDADTITFLQKAAALNYRRVWNFAPWRETVTSSTYAISDVSQIVISGANGSPGSNGTYTRTSFGTSTFTGNQTFANTIEWDGGSSLWQINQAFIGFTFYTNPTYTTNGTTDFTTWNVGASGIAPAPTGAITLSRTVTLGTNVETPLSVAWGDDELTPMDLATIISQDADLLDNNRTGTPQAYYFKGRNSSGVAQIDVYPALETSSTTTLKVIEKLQCLTRSNYIVDFPPSSNAIDDELRLPHVSHVVLALTHADALERERQYGKAQLVVQTANTDLASMANYELSQVGGMKQITPTSLGELGLEEII
jgi:hypothetical protein